MARLFVFGQPTLHGVEGDPHEHGVWLELPREPVFFGRAGPSQPGERCVRLDIDCIARRHFVIEPVDGGWQVRDLGSTAGTRVNGQNANPPVRLKAGDVIDLAQRIAIFRDDDGGER